MSAHYVYYTKPTQAQVDLSIHDAEGIPLDHWSSAQFKKLREGDHLWIVTISEGRLFLLGHLAVDQMLNFQKAVKYLGREDLYDATYHAVCEPEHAEHMEFWDIHEQAPGLRFESANDRLVFEDDGLLAAQQMQSMRRLTEESVSLLEDIWYSEVDESDDENDADAETDAEGGYVMDSELRRQIEQAAVAHVTAALTDEGWVVESVEAERCGYDLHCTQGDQERHVEVKGTQGEQPAFIITAQELRCADEDNAFELWVVVSVLADEPKAHRYSGEELRTHFRLHAVQYRAVLKEVAGGADEEE
ncbi:MAG: DUF3883 domain-containing protein [Verrucomicrobiaceae bacterium]